MLRMARPEGYGTGVVDAHENSHTAYDAGPLPLKLVWLPKVTVNAGVQQADDGCENKKRYQRQNGPAENDTIPHDSY